MGRKDFRKESSENGFRTKPTESEDQSTLEVDDFRVEREANVGAKLSGVIKTVHLEIPNLARGYSGFSKRLASLMSIFI